MRIRLLVILVLTAASAGAPGTAAAATSFNVTASGMSAYLVDDVRNPTLTLTRGQTYTFNLDTPQHPFWIATVRGAGDTESNAFSQGVTGNGADSGTLTFVVPASAPAQLFYQCGAHDPMGGTLNIVGAAPAPPAAAAVPALGPIALLALAGLLLAAGVVASRRRRGQNTMAPMRCHDQ